jgi:hypothetical protein
VQFIKLHRTNGHVIIRYAVCIILYTIFHLNEVHFFSAAKDRIFMGAPLDVPEVGYLGFFLGKTL